MNLRAKLCCTEEVSKMPVTMQNNSEKNERYNIATKVRKCKGIYCMCCQWLFYN